MIFKNRFFRHVMNSYEHGMTLVASENNLDVFYTILNFFASCIYSRNISLENSLMAIFAVHWILRRGSLNHTRMLEGGKREVPGFEGDFDEISFETHIT